MAIITLEYNTRNEIAKKTIEYILSLGMFRVKAATNTVTTKKTALDKAIEELETGKTVLCENFDDYLKKVNYEAN
ncbi:hypothetical protein AGMMS50239_08200 [Bacteroidia bacterium]|nr:hypothetical protein AGMMS50239_08200 [Bacteroidia bacterium]